MFGQDAAEGHLSHLNNSNRYYGTNKGNTVLEELHKLWKHHTDHLREMVKEMSMRMFKAATIAPSLKVVTTGQPVMVRNHACHTFEPKHLLDYRILQILNDSTLLLVTPNGKESKMNINKIKLCSTSKLVKNAWDSFLESIKSNC